MECKAVMTRLWGLGLTCGLVLAGLTGCGGNSAPNATATAQNGQTTSAEGAAADASGSGTRLPTASISGGKGALPVTASTADVPANAPLGKAAAAVDDDDDNEDLTGMASKSAAEQTSLVPEEEMEKPAEGTVDALIHEALQLRLQRPPMTEDVDVLKKDRETRNRKIVELTQQAISRTHDQKDKDNDRRFTTAARQLLEARLQLALLGEEADIEALYGDAGALYKRDPKSPAAAEGAYTLVNFAYTNARAKTTPDLHWLLEFARQAEHYAVTFPKEELKSTPLLFTAARSCELNNRPDEALRCYTLLQERFPQSPFAARSAGIIRRLKLAGNLIELSGPKLDGQSFSTNELLGQVIVVVSWSTEAKPFHDMLPQLQELSKKYGKQGVTFVGLNFDEEVSPVSEYVLQNKLGWTQIHFTNPAQRGWNNPIALFYGILEIPAIWVIDAQGNVVSTSVKADQLEGLIRQQLLNSQAGVSTAPTESASKGKSQAEE